MRDFKQNLEGPNFKQNLEGPALIIYNIKTTNQDIGEMLTFIKQNHQITELLLNGTGTNDQDMQKIADSSAVSQLTKLSLLYNDHITGRGISYIANSSTLSNLTSIRLSGQSEFDTARATAIAKSILPKLTSVEIAVARIGDEGAKALAKSKTITTLNLPQNNIGDEGAKALAESKTITALDLRSNNIGAEGAKALAKSKTITALDLRSNNIGAEGAIAIAKAMSNAEVKVEEYLCSIITALRPHYQTGQTEIPSETIKELIFALARDDYRGKSIKYFLERPEEYLFLINSKNEENQYVANYYTHSPEIQRFLFEKGAIPLKTENQENVMRNIINNTQSVHTSDITKRTYFFANELVQDLGQDASTLIQKAESFKDSVTQLFTKNSELAINLLDLTVQEKRSVMEKTLGTSELPSDQEFVQAVNSKASQVLNQKYLNKADQYYTQNMQYDWTEGAEKRITIPESIGLIATLAQTTKPTIDQMQELTATLYEKHKIKSKIEAFNKLQDLNSDEIAELFKKESSGLDIVEVFQEQQKFKLAKQLYIAATTYGDNATACTQGTWTQIITTAAEIDPDISNKWSKQQKEQRAKAAVQKDITEENIMPFLDSCVKKELLKQNGVILSDPALTTALEDLGLANLQITIPENITLSEQKVLSSINTYFCHHINEFLPNYQGVQINNNYHMMHMMGHQRQPLINSMVPTLEQYKIIINQVSEVPEMQNFVQNPKVYKVAQEFNSTNITGVNIMGEENATNLDFYI